MRLAPPPRRRSEPTIALINVVFLMLVFFLVAGQIAAPTDRDLRLVEAEAAAARAPDDALIIRRDGSTAFRGAPMAPEAFAAARIAAGAPVMRILPDREASAADLLRIAAALRAGGATGLRIVTERALQ